MPKVSQVPKLGIGNAGEAPQQIDFNQQYRYQNTNHEVEKLRSAFASAREKDPQRLEYAKAQTTAASPNPSPR